MKIRNCFFLAAVASLLACNAKVGTSSTTQDNHVDNSQHGILSCADGFTIVCSPVAGTTQTGVTHECKGPSDETVTREGPEFFNLAPTNCNTDVTTTNPDGSGSSSSVDLT